MNYYKSKKAAWIFDSIALCIIAVSFLIGMNYNQANLGGSGLELPFNGTFWLGIGGFIAISMMRLAYFKRALFSDPFSYFALCIGAMLFPLVYTERTYLTHQRELLCAVLVTIVFLFTLYQYKSMRFKQRILLIILLSTVLQAIWGLIQYYLVFDTSPLFRGAVQGNPYGTFQQVNVFGSYLTIGSLLALYFVEKAKKPKRVLWLIAATLIITTNFHLLVLSGALTAKLVGFVSMFIYVLLINVRKKRLWKPSYLVFVALVFGLLPKAWFDIRPPLSDSVAQLMQSENNPYYSREDSRLAISGSGTLLGTRPTIYGVSLQMIADKPFMGHGLGRFPKQYLLYQGDYLKRNPGAPAEYVIAHPHNTILKWWIDLGLVSALAVIAIVLGFFVYMVRGICDPKILLIALPIVAQAMIETPFVNSAPHLCILLILMYASTLKNTQSVKASMPVGVVVVAITIAGVTYASNYLLHSLNATKQLVAFYDTNKQDIELLRAVEDPAGYKLRYEFEEYGWNLRNAQQQQRISKGDLQNFVNWSIQVIQFAPLQWNYENSIIALMLLGETKLALDFASEAAFMYPHNPKFAAFKQQLEEQSGN